MFIFHSAANSITWGRLLPQIVFQVSAYLDLVEQKVISVGDPVDVCIPTGNFGNILGAFYSQVSFFFFKRKENVMIINISGKLNM
jgi:threonine synthase